MWKAEKRLIQAGKIHQYRILVQEKYLSHLEVLAEWQSNPDFRTFYTTILQSSPFKAYFWEHPPLNDQNLTDSYEFVLVKTDLLLGVRPQDEVFKKYFKKNEPVVSFLNLGKDAQLVVPKPVSAHSIYVHLAAFIKQAPLEQLDAFWRVVGEQMQMAIGSSNKWLSTSGLGVYWLHVRIDSRPKYYSYRAYAKG